MFLVFVIVAYFTAFIILLPKILLYCIIGQSYTALVQDHKFNSYITHSILEPGLHIIVIPLP